MLHIHQGINSMEEHYYIDLDTGVKILAMSGFEKKVLLLRDEITKGDIERSGGIVEKKDYSAEEEKVSLDKIGHFILETDKKVNFVHYYLDNEEIIIV